MGGGEIPTSCVLQTKVPTRFSRLPSIRFYSCKIVHNAVKFIPVSPVYRPPFPQHLFPAVPNHVSPSPTPNDVCHH